MGVFPKGPWRVFDADADTPEITGADGFRVAEVADIAILPDYHERTGIAHWGRAEGVTFIERPAAEVRGAAHLIAAAPDLLAALEGMVADAEAIVEDYGIAACLCCADQCHYCAARAAIAKARGAK